MSEIAFCRLMRLDHCSNKPDRVIPAFFSFSTPLFFADAVWCRADGRHLSAARARIFDVRRRDVPTAARPREKLRGGRVLLIARRVQLSPQCVHRRARAQTTGSIIRIMTRPPESTKTHVRAMSAIVFGAID